MRVVVAAHPKGLVLQQDAGVEKTGQMSAVDLRRHLDATVSLLPNGAYLVPRSCAFKLLSLFPPNETEWESAALEFACSQRSMRDQQLKAQIEVALALADPNSVLAGYDKLGQLDAHQTQAVAAITAESLRGMALFDEQGTGKTISALASFDRLRSNEHVKRLLVVAPKSVLATWQAECAKLLGDRYEVALIVGRSNNRRKLVQAQHDILLISYEGLVRDAGLIRVIVSAQPRTYMLVVDESYFVKNPSTSRAKAIAAIRPFCERAIILCGTPAPNSPFDIINQINIADGGIAFAGRRISDDPEQAEAQINRGLDQFIYLRRLKEDVFPGIPAKTIERILLELQPIQRAIYDKAHDELIVAVRSVDDHEFQRQLSSFIARRVALLQVCSHPRSLDPLYSEDPAKLLALDRLLTDLVEHQGKKVVIWSFFRQSLQAIADRYQHYGIARIDGSVADIEARVDAIRRFQDNPDTRIFVGNAASAGAGITLTAAHHAIYESFSNQAAHYMQSVDRIHRRGQMHDVTYHVLIAEDTIEEREFERLRQKERASRNLLGDKYKEPITRERFLADLGETHAV